MLGFWILQAAVTMKFKRRRRRRRRRQRPKEPKDVVGAEDASSIHDLADDPLRLILLCLDSPIWLMRAACVCKRWRRVVTDGADEGRAFLRLLSSLHPPTVVGQYQNRRGDSRFVPSSSAIDNTRFSVDFLVKNLPWDVADCYGGLVLLSMGFPWRPRSVSHFIVYDPLTRQHRLISSPPSRPPNDRVYGYGANDTLLLHGDDGNISISNFRVLCELNVAASNPKACVFSTANGGGWGWRFLMQSAGDDIFDYCCRHKTTGRTDDGSLYMIFRMNHGLGSWIIKLDSTSLEFSRFELRTRISSFGGSTLTTVVHGAGVLGPSSPPTTSLVHVHGEVLELFRKIHGSSEWILEHSIPNLSVATRGLSICLEKEEFLEWMTMVDIIVDGSTFAILSSRRSNSLDDFINYRRWWFSFNVNTMELQVLPQEIYQDTREIFNYTLPWPQSLQACPCS